MTNEDKTPTETWNERVNRFMATGHAHLHASVATAVDALNGGLAAAEQTTRQVQAPVSRAWDQASAAEQQLETQLNGLYKRRNELGPQMVGGAALAGGLLNFLRKRSVFRFASGAIVMGGLAYVTVYEPIPVKRIPSMVMEQFQPKEKK